MKKALGYFLVSLPFILITAFCIYSGGFLSTLIMWAAVLVLCGLIVLGVKLID